ITRAYPDAIRARMFALLSSAWVLPSLIGPAVAGALAEWATWRLVFLGLFPLLLVAVTLTLPALRRMAVAASDRPADRRLLLALRLALGTGLLLAGLDLGNIFLAVAGVAAGAVLAGPALLRLMPPGTLRVRPGLPAGMAVNAFLNFGFFGAEAFVPLGLTSLRGLSTGLAGVPLTAAAITWTAGSWLQARLDTPDAGRGRQRRVTAGFVLVAAGIAITAITVVNDRVPVLVASAGWAVGGLGMGLAYPTISLLVLAQAPSGQEGNVAGSLRMAELLSVAVGAGLGGAAIALGHRMSWAEHTGLGVAFALALAVALLGCVASRRLSVIRDT
ncbi:MAG: MFS transporter, partial [Dehalococcoidia bacterium]